MNNQSVKKTSNNSSGFSNNPFARALAETEKSAFEDGSRGTDLAPNIFDQQSNPYTPSWEQDWAERQRQKAEEQTKKEALRKKLHDRINPVDTRDVFNARENQVRKEIEEVRHELKLLAQELAGLHDEVEISLMSNPANPGTSGKYYLNFFQKLRAWIMMLRQKIHNARTWATQANNKKAKSKKRGGAFIFEGKSGHEQTKTIFDMMHHEVSNARNAD